MGEAAPIGSLVITRATESPKVGDIITYELHSGKLITHRVAEVRDDQLLVTKGDTNESADPWRVELSSIRGVVQDVPPGARSEEDRSELQSRMRISADVVCFTNNPSAPSDKKRRQR